ncbi:MAG: bifunctional isocitrate dehydrogenase kinase/phosphatase [Pirellulales bacterium]|nr:bifunctional isocitrate dehydrogenase kinase/phosphatase [Pirellulales bacterium]
MTQVTTSRLANVIARAIRRAFDLYQHEFGEITRRARQRFVDRDWHGMQADSAERLDVYEAEVAHIGQRVIELLEDRVHDRMVWGSIKAVFSSLIADRDDWEIAETFYNSVTRRIFTTVGVDNEIEFVHTDFDSPPHLASQPVYRTYGRGESVQKLLQAILTEYELPLRGPQLDHETRLAARCIEDRLRAIGALRVVERTEIVKSIFYRGEYAYVIGRMSSGSHMLPLALCLKHDERGITIDAVLTDENDLSLLFSFARSYFHVEVERPYDLVAFINSIIPRKRAAEIYISIGYNKHGKTELYRNALRHLAASDDQYELAQGLRGMVMICFTMPSYAVVFKIIKDRFDYPKTCTRHSVIDKYHFVFKHDRAGRLVDAQEYKYLELDRHRFKQELLDELLAVAAETVFVRGDRVVIRHCYAERRVVPLNVFLQEADDAAARAAVIDYGQAIKDLAWTNIFPGDLMLKNFGVTRHGRVVFYDYDEISEVTECNIRRLPEDYGMLGEPSHGVGLHDMFPEEFLYFIGLSGPLRDVFLEHHGDLFTVEFWQEVQRRLRARQIIHIAPYGADQRLPREEESAARLARPA